MESISCVKNVIGGPEAPSIQIAHTGLDRHDWVDLLGSLARYGASKPLAICFGIATDLAVQSSVADCTRWGSARYNQVRTHWSLCKDAPETRPIELTGSVYSRPSARRLALPRYRPLLGCQSNLLGKGDQRDQRTAACPWQLWSCAVVCFRYFRSFLFLSFLLYSL